MRENDKQLKGSREGGEGQRQGKSHSCKLEKGLRVLTEVANAEEKLGVSQIVLLPNRFI